MQPGKPFGIQPVAGRRTVDFTLYQSGLLEDFQMLRNGGLGKRRRRHDLAADTLAALGELLQDREPGGVADGLQHHH